MQKHLAPYTNRIQLADIQLFYAVQDTVADVCEIPLSHNDQNTDNMVAGGYSSTYFEKGQWRVPNTGGGWDFTQIRYCNYFFENVLPKFEAGKIEGNCEQILHYVGEMYFIRAWIYYSKLKSFGDFPIITEVLPDNQSVLTEKSVR